MAVTRSPDSPQFTLAPPCQAPGRSSVPAAEQSPSTAPARAAASAAFPASENV